MQTKKGYKRSQNPREGEHTIQEEVQKESRPLGRVKTLGKTDTPSKKGYKGSQEPWEGGHTIQHQGGHLKKAVGTPNSHQN